MQARYILLPTRGFVASEPYSAPATLQFLASLTPAPHLERPSHLLVLDSIRETGAKLVTLPTGAIGDFRRAHPGTRIVPEVFYQPARAPRPSVRIPATRSATASAAGVVLTVELLSDATPVADVEVIAFIDFAEGRGAQGRTNRRGQVRLRLPATTRTIERLYLFPRVKAWPRVIRNHAAGPDPVRLRPIEPDFADSRAACYGPAQDEDGRGVTIGVIDTGCGPHPWLQVAGGVNTVYGEDETDWFDIDGHGTHVAGLVGANGPTFRGTAPAARVRAYRVFGRKDDGASNFAIAKAIDRAVADGCDLLNMSLGGGPLDVLTDEAIKDARSRGVLCIVAAGNEGGPVAWPGRHALAMAVSAVGVRGRWPRDATQAEEVERPFGREFDGDPCFIARFSNRGPEIDLAAPGLGIVSTMPPDGLGVMDGTSMACPLATAALACRLARRPDVLGQARDTARADEIERLALTGNLDLALPHALQGHGMPR
ncbi:MAG TPA: S8 family serine peptidase [Burkholderiaceae bacterium]|nr:S8 family serine peptidase [Burkholderiaceae bacterium]